MEFTPKYEYSQTKTNNKCEYCGHTIYFDKRDENIVSYKLNNKHICRNCLRDYANSLGLTIRELISK